MRRRNLGYQPHEFFGGTARRADLAFLLRRRHAPPPPGLTLSTFAASTPCNSPTRSIYIFRERCARLDSPGRSHEFRLVAEPSVAARRQLHFRLEIAPFLKLDFCQGLAFPVFRAEYFNILDTTPLGAQRNVVFLFVRRREGRGHGPRWNAARRFRRHHISWEMRTAYLPRNVATALDVGSFSSNNCAFFLLLAFHCERSQEIRFLQLFVLESHDHIC